MDETESPSGFLRTLARAEAMSANRVWPAAAALWAEVVAVNPVEGRFWTALATARVEAGDHAGALAAYEEALALRDGYPAETVFHIARCLAHLGERLQALDRLEQALAMGYRDLERARVDRAFDELRDDPRYRELVSLINVAGLSRDDGWRADLQILSRELKRRAYDPFRFVTEAEFDAAVAGLDQRLPELTDIQVVIELERLLRLLGDGHARLTPDRDDERWQHSLPVLFYDFAEGLHIIAAAPDQAGLLGAEVLRFDDRPAADVISALDGLMPRDNDNGQLPRNLLSWRLRQLPVLHGLGVVDDPHRVRLTVRGHDGETRTVTVVTDTSRPASRDEHRNPYPAGWSFLPATLPGPMPLYQRNRTVPYWFTFLRPEQTVYFQFNSVRDAPEEPFAAFCDRLFAFIAEHDVEKLILDIRWNGGGNTLLEIQLLRHIIASKINQRGRLFVIIGRATFSAAQNGAGMLSRNTEAIFVGEPTGSSPTFVGETVPFTLPSSKIEANVSDLLWQGTWPMDYRIWMAPLLYAPPTFAAYRANRDPAVEAILAWDEHLPGA